jgi:formylglycine-generating enzyme required for sulfatase activity
MVYIPAGSFTMGDALDGKPDAVAVDTTVSAFYMDATEVTYTQWQTVYTWATNNGYSFDNPGRGKGATYPVEMVSWYDSVKWCNARSEKEGKTPAYYITTNNWTNGTNFYRTGNIDLTSANVNWSANGYRLATEAEWERAARGGLSSQRFPWGEKISQSLANYYGDTNQFSYDLGPNGFNSTWDTGGYPFTSPVASFATNAYGLYGMAGNVCEWCWDWYGTPYSGGTDPHGSVTGSHRVLRGGGWNRFASACAVASRIHYVPGDTSVSDERESDFGFRAVLPLGQ